MLNPCLNQKIFSSNVNIFDTVLQICVIHIGATFMTIFGKHAIT